VEAPIDDFFKPVAKYTFEDGFEQYMNLE